MLPLLSATTWQASRAFNLIRGIFAGAPALAQLIEGETAGELRLRNAVDIVCRPASFRTIRGATAIGFVADEVGFWYFAEQARNPDTEIFNAMRPALATLGGPLLVVSSPYGKRGELWNAFKRDYGFDGDPKIVVINAASRRMNPTLSEAIVERAYERDPQAAASEFGGIFRTDVSGFVDFALVDAAVDRGVLVRPPQAGIDYRSACDPSGGAHDSFTLAICHDDGETAILDCLVEARSPFNPTSVVADMAKTLASYRLTSTVGDKYASGWVPDAFSKVGVKYEPSERTRSQGYLDALPLFTAGRVRLIDNPRMVAQFAGLERRTTAVGRDMVDHGPGGRDDCCNAAALGPGERIFARHGLGQGRRAVACDVQPASLFFENWRLVPMTVLARSRRVDDEDEDINDFDPAYFPRKVYKDGRGPRVRLMLTDSAPPSRRALFDARNHQPHFAVVDAADPQVRAAERAYYDRSKWLQDAWRNPSGAMQTPPDNGNGNGSDPDDDDDPDAVAEASRQAYIDHISNQWRVTGPYAFGAAPPRMMGGAVSPPHPSNGGNPYSSSEADAIQAAYICQISPGGARPGLEGDAIAAARRGRPGTPVGVSHGPGPTADAASLRDAADQASAKWSTVSKMPGGVEWSIPTSSPACQTRRGKNCFCWMD